MSRTALHRWRQTLTSWTCPELPCTGGERCMPSRAHQNHYLKNCTGFLFELESASRSRQWSTKSEQVASHHILRISSTTTDRPGHFIPHRWLSSRNRLWRVRLVVAVLQDTAAETCNNPPVTMRSDETLGPFRRQVSKQFFNLSLYIQLDYCFPRPRIACCIWYVTNFIYILTFVETCVCNFLHPSNANRLLAYVIR